MSNLNRRQFLTLGASGAGAILLYQCAGRPPVSSSTVPLVSQSGLLETQLTARRGAVNVAGQSIELMSYNDQIPGPRLEVRPGDTVRLTLDNQLSEATNLHFHGLHVSPTGNADNIFLEIPARERFTYEFTIPTSHPGGTFYYHPHRHGLVGRQVFAGMGGILVVRGALDEIPEVQAAQEAFLFLKDIDPNHPMGRVRPMQQMRGREGELVTVNGQRQPRISIDSNANGLLRLRLVNGSAARFYRLSLEDHPLYLIATDGGALEEPVELSELLLSPGERAEVLVRGNRTAGEYRLMNLPYDRGGMGMMGNQRGGMNPGMGHGMGRRGGGRSQTEAQEPEVLATIAYSGETRSVPLPTQLLPVEALPEAQRTRQFRLHHGMTPRQGMVFLINGQAYHHDRIDTQVILNTVEDWVLVNPDRMDHPFHVHTNPFQVIERNGTPEPFRAWKDTVLVPAGQTVRIRTRFETFTGKSLYHCHILDHEDLGMAGILDIQA